MKYGEVCSETFSPDVWINLWDYILSDFGRDYAIFFLEMSETRIPIQQYISFKNIARGTTDPGFWLFNLSYLSC